MNVEIGTEAAQFPEKEFINGIVFAVRSVQCSLCFVIFPLFIMQRLVSFFDYGYFFNT